MYRVLLPLAAIALSLTLCVSGGPAPADAGSGKLLFHVVSVKFKETATKEQITEVENAFAALRDKVPGVVTLSWGTNSSPEARNKGFTHCFVLTFASEAARDVYLAHAEHKAFGKLFGPVKDDVMVIDFWNHPPAAGGGIGFASPVPVTLFHVVSLKFKEAATKEQIGEVEKAFAALKDKIPNVVHLDWGTDISLEHKNKGYTHCFVLRFPTDADRDNYIAHPDHKAFGKLLGPVLDDVTVIDFSAK